MTFFSKDSETVIIEADPILNAPICMGNASSADIESTWTTPHLKLTLSVNPEATLAEIRRMKAIVKDFRGNLDKLAPIKVVIKPENVLTVKEKSLRGSQALLQLTQETTFESSLSIGSIVKIGKAEYYL